MEVLASVESSRRPALPQYFFRLTGCIPSGNYLVPPKLMIIDICGVASKSGRSFRELNCIHPYKLLLTLDRNMLFLSRLLVLSVKRLC